MAPSQDKDLESFAKIVQDSKRTTTEETAAALLVLIKMMRDIRSDLELKINSKADSGSHLGDLKEFQDRINDAFESFKSSLSNEVSSQNTDLKKLRDDIASIKEGLDVLRSASLTKDVHSESVADVATVNDDARDFSLDVDIDFIYTELTRIESAIPKLITPMSAEEIRDKLESLIDDERLDASFIKNLPENKAEGTRRPFFGGGFRRFEQLHDVYIVDPVNGQVPIWNSTTRRWENGTISGGGSVDSVNGQTGVVVLDAGDVGADPSGSASTALASANAYTDSAIAALSFVESVVAGSGINVDNTDPSNPVVSSTITQYTDEIAQDAVGNAVGNGLDYNDTTGAISVDESELTHDSLGGLTSGDPHTQYVAITPASSSRNVIVPSADRVALTVRPYSSQTADIFVTENNAASLKHFYVDKDGYARLGALAQYTSGPFTYRDSNRLYFDYFFNGSRQNNYIECVPNSPGGQNQAVMNFIVSGQNFFTVSGVSGPGAPLGMTAGGLVIGSGGGATIRTANTAAMTLRGEFNTITLQGETNTGGAYEIMIKGKNPFGGATASNLCAFMNDTVVHSYITPVGGLILNETGVDADSRFEGDTDANLFFLDASTDRIGIGTATPSKKLDVNGDINIPSGSAYYVGGNAGVSGSFTTVDLKTVTVEKGIITAIV